MAYFISKSLSSLNKCSFHVCRRYAATQNLPKLPVPPLEGTLSELVQSADFMLSPSEYQRTCKLLTEFFKNDGDGGRLQKHLEHRATVMDNWLNDYIMKDQYLANRNPIPIYQNAGIAFPMRMETQSLDEHLAIVAKITFGLIDSVEKMESPDFPTETMKGLELDMSQFNERFKLARVAGLKRDKVEKVSEKRRHMVVAHNNHFFKIDLYDSEGVLYKQGQIWRALKETVAQSPNKGVPLGILTGDNRDVWGEVYSKLIKDESNKAALDSLHKAVLVFCLDGPSEPSDTLNHATSDALNAIHGGGSQRNGGNRFYDNENMLITTPDGSLTTYGGQCLANAWIMQFPLKNTLKFIMDSKLPGAEENQFPEAQKLEINIDENTEKVIQESCLRFDKMVQKYDMLCSRFDLFGKEFIKKCGVSPDTYIQLAVGLALMKIHNQGGYDFEQAQSRRFRGGRTGIVRTCFAQSMEFNRAMLNRKKSDSERIQSFMEAAEHHQRRVRLAMDGLSAVRHLQGLQCAVSELGIETPELFKDPGFIKITSKRCFSTQIPSPGMVFPFNSLFDCQYSTGFVPLDEEIMWTICTWKNPNSASAKQLYSMICESLEDLYNLLKKSGT